MSSSTEERLSFKEKFAYGLGDTASNFFFQTFNLFLLYYYTDIFGIGPAAAGKMFLVTRIVDCITDPLMGLLADRTRTRWGKFRPWLLWMAVPYGVLGYLMFMNPELSDSGKLVWAYLTYSAMMLAYTAINIPYGALMGVMSHSSSVRTTLSSFRFIGAFGGGVLVASLVTPLKKYLGGGNELLGFQLTMAIFAVVSIVMFLMTFAWTKERVAPAGDEDAKLGRDLANLFRNKAWVVMLFAGIFTLTNVGVRNAVMIYYMKYYITDDGAAVFFFMDKSALFLSSGMWAMILGVACTKWFTARWGKKQLMIVLSALNAFSMGILFFFPPEMFWTVFVINFVGTFLNGPTPALVWAMYADAADYGEWKFNRRTTALNFSAAQFGQKMGLAVGGSLAGICLGWFGFVANEAQTADSLLGIRILFAIAPAGFAFLNVIALMFYPLGEETVLQIETELAERKAAHPA